MYNTVSAANCHCGIPTGKKWRVSHWSLLLVCPLVAAQGKITTICQMLFTFCYLKYRLDVAGSGRDSARRRCMHTYIHIYVYIYTRVCVCVYSWFTLLYSRIQHNIVKQLYSNLKINYFKKEKKNWPSLDLPIIVPGFIVRLRLIVLSIEKVAQGTVLVKSVFT